MLLFLKSPITIEGIKKDNRKLKCKRAAGVDGIAAEFYKHGCNELLPVLLFNTIIADAKYTSSWATSIIHPVPDNYRKVTVMPYNGKLFESSLNKRLSFKNDVCNDNDPFQAGLEVTPGQLIIYS